MTWPFSNADRKSKSGGPPDGWHPSSVQEYLDSLSSEVRSVHVLINDNWYKRDAEGKWIVDQEKQQESVNREKKILAEHNRRVDLFWALRSRLLTNEEMNEVSNLRDTLLYDPCCHVCTWTGLGGLRDNQDKTELERRMNDALYQQMRLRALGQGKTNA